MFICNLGCLAQTAFVRTLSVSGTRFIKLTDGGYAFKRSANTCGALGLYEFSLLKTNDDAEIIWNATYGWDYLTSVARIVETNDLGIAIGSWAKAPLSNIDALLTKVDSAGKLQWAKGFDGGENDHTSNITTTNDGHILLAGTAHDTQYGMFLIKTDANGNMIWNKIYGTLTSAVVTTHVHVSTDGNYVLVGYIEVNATTKAPIVLRISPTGVILSSKVYRGPADMNVEAVEPTDDNGCIINGIINLSGNPYLYAMKLTSSGNVEWCRVYSKIGEDEVKTVVRTPDGGYMHLGADDGQSSGGDQDMQVIRTDSLGKLVWAKEYGGVEGQRGFSLYVDSQGWALLEGASDAHSGRLFYRIDPHGNAACDQEVSMITDSSLTITIFTSTVYASSPYQSYVAELSEGYCVLGTTTLL